MVRSMLKKKSLPRNFWGEASMTIVHMLNVCPTKRLGSMVREEAWSGKKLSVNHFKIFRSLCYRHIHGQRRKKLYDKSEKMIFVGYNLTGSYKLYNPENNRSHSVEMFILMKQVHGKSLNRRDKISSNIYLEWEDVESSEEIQREATNNKDQRVPGRPTRAIQAPSRFRDYQVYSVRNI